LWVGIDAMDKGHAGIKELSHGGMTVVLGDILSHPFPQTLDRVEVGAVARERDQGKAQVICSGLDRFGSMPWSAIPDNHDRRRNIVQPHSKMIQELDRLFLVAAAFIPDETLSPGEVIGAIPVDTVRQRWAITQAPGRFADGGPGVSQIHVAMEVGFIHVNQQNLFLPHLFVEFLKALHKGRTLLRIGFHENLLALLPTQTVLLQECAQRTATDITLEHLLDPALQFLQIPAMSGQTMVDGFCVRHCLDNPVSLSLDKKGVRPPVRR